jgi:pilus assembly protein Flp/PilA
LNTIKNAAADWVASLVAREEGQALVEYGLIISLVALVVVGILAFVGTDVSTVFSSIASNL